MKKFFLFSIIFLGDTICEQNKLCDLYKFADVLNIEGGIIPKTKLNEKQKWFNIATVLDRPFIDGIEYDEWTKKNTYFLKETSIPDYNEQQNIFVQISTIKYCVENANKVCNKNSDENKEIVIHVHRGSSGIKYLNLLTNLFEKIFDWDKYKKSNANDLIANELFVYELPDNVTIRFRYGYKENFVKLELADIVISISLVAGFNSKYKSGDILIPLNFIPMNLDTMKMDLNSRYFVKNYFREYLDDIINSQDQKILDLINQNFVSENSNKQQHKAKLLTKEDFNQVSVLQVNRNFNPSTLPEFFEF